MSNRADSDDHRASTCWWTAMIGWSESLPASAAESMVVSLAVAQRGIFAARRQVTTTASSAWVTNRPGRHGRHHRNWVSPSVPAAPVSASPNGRHQTLPILAP